MKELKNENKMIEVQMRIKELEERKSELKEKIDVLMEEWREVGKELSEVKKEKYGIMGKGADGSRDVKMMFDGLKLKYDNWAINGGKLWELGRLLNCSYGIMYGKEKYDRVEGSKSYRYYMLKEVKEKCFVKNEELWAKNEDGEEIDVVKFLGL